MEGLKEGRIVYFVFDEHSVSQVQTGNKPTVGEVAAAQVVRVWGPTGCINLKVNLDGPDHLWVTSVEYSAEPKPRSWHWMYDGQAARGEAK